MVSILNGGPGPKKSGAKSLPEKPAKASPPAKKKKAKKSKAAAPKKKAKTKKRKPSSTPKKPAKKKAGRPRLQSRKEAGEAQKAYSAAFKEKTSKAVRDIAPLPVDLINWERRLACKKSLKLFSETYLSPVFYLGWSKDQERCIEILQEILISGGMFSLAMPRGGGKTALCRSAILWATAYAHRRFPFFIGSMQNKAIQTLDFIKTYWYRSRELREDFPEISWSIYRLENRHQLARGQLYNGEPTCVVWGVESIRYPSLLMPQEVAQTYLDNDPASIRYLDNYEAFLCKSAGIVVSTAGIDGSIRGEAEVHPITLEQPRPDLALLDDIQKDQKADSPRACEKLELLIDGAIQGLVGPGEQIAALMPCTVIRPDDISDVYLDPMRKPEWRGERCSMVTGWPEGITDYEITLDSKAGKLWEEYGDLRKRSLRLHKDLRLATDFYSQHRKVMDKGFTVSWEERYTKEGRFQELSAQQHSMNLRLTNPLTFCSEYQNKPKRTDEAGLALMLSAAQLSEKTVSIPQAHLPLEASYVVAFIDIQDEILFWGAMGVAPDFTGLITDYGTFPEISAHSYTKNQTLGWSMLTTAFFQAYPNLRHKATKTTGGKLRAPREAKIYWALSQLVPRILSKPFARMDKHKTPLYPCKLGVDVRWGQTSEVAKRYIRESGFSQVVPYLGQPVPPTRKQYEEYSRTKGWLFEDQLHPQVKECRWIYKPDETGLYQLSVDVNRVKSQLHSQLAYPQGSPGSLALYDAPPETHHLFCSHLCDSEYPEPVAARGISKDIWSEREGRPDNDYLDIATGCWALASMAGACLRTEGEKPAPQRRVSIRELWERKRENS